MTAPDKILIVKLSSLGDILHTLPAYQSLRRSFPDARIDWVVERRMRFLLDAVPGIDEVHLLDTKALRQPLWNPAEWKTLGQLVRRVRSRRYDVAIDFQGLLKTAFLTWVMGIRERIGFPPDLVRESPSHWFYTKTPEPSIRRLHITDQNMLLALAAGAKQECSPIEFRVQMEDRSEVEKRLEKEKLSDFVVINPGGGWYTKRWKPEKFGELARRIKLELKLSVVVTTGPNEQELYDSIRSSSDSAPPVNLQIPFLQLIPLLGRARLLVSGDTGPYHLACAMGVPAVGIFGPTPPWRNGPWKDGEETVVHELPCSFCNGRTCPTQNECMDIDVDEVYGAIRRRLAQ